MLVGRMGRVEWVGQAGDSVDWVMTEGVKMEKKKMTKKKPTSKTSSIPKEKNSTLDKEPDELVIQKGKAELGSVRFWRIVLWL